MTTHDQHAEASRVDTHAEQPEASRMDDELSAPGMPAESPEGMPAESPDPKMGSPAATAKPSNGESLFGGIDLSGLRSRWDDVQAAFVDDPKECVQKADHLVSDVVEQLTTGFGQARSRLEEQWSQGQEASTEDLRLALKRYREFFQRLLSV
jgi:hypothetical protein